MQFLFSHSLICSCLPLCKNSAFFSFIWGLGSSHEERREGLSLFGPFLKYLSLFDLLQHPLLSCNFNHCCKKDEIKILVCFFTIPMRMYAQVKLKKGFRLSEFSAAYQSLHFLSFLLLKNPMACMKLHSIFLQRNRHLIIFLLPLALLLMLSLNPSQFMAQGRLFPRLPDANLRKDEETAAKMRSLIGSRPPRCDQRCRSCGHCEAVQVPITPTIKFLEEQIYATPTIAYSRGDGISNYKPMCWKCKCGDLIFNP